MHQTIKKHMSPTQLNNNNSSKTILISDRDSWTGIKGLTETQNGRVCAITTLARPAMTQLHKSQGWRKIFAEFNWIE